jgi:hypothetical protein
MNKKRMYWAHDSDEQPYYLKRPAFNSRQPAILPPWWFLSCSGDVLMTALYGKDKTNPLRQAHYSYS